VPQTEVHATPLEKARALVRALGLVPRDVPDYEMDDATVETFDSIVPDGSVMWRWLLRLLDRSGT